MPQSGTFMHSMSPAQPRPAQSSPAQPPHRTVHSSTAHPAQVQSLAHGSLSRFKSCDITYCKQNLKPTQMSNVRKGKKLQNTEVLPIRCHFVLQQEGFTAEAVEELSISPAPDSKPTSDILHPGKGCSNQCPFRASLDRSTHWVQLHSSSYQQCFPLHNANSFTSCN